LLRHGTTHKPFSIKGNAKTDRQASLFHHLSSSLPIYEASTLFLLIHAKLLLIILFLHVLARSYATYPSRDYTASHDGSDQSRSSRACQTPLWLHSQTLHTYLYIRSGAFGVSAEVSH